MDTNKDIHSEASNEKNNEGYHKTKDAIVDTLIIGTIDVLATDKIISINNVRHISDGTKTN